MVQELKWAGGSGQTEPGRWQAVLLAPGNPLNQSLNLHHFTVLDIFFFLPNTLQSCHFFSILTTSKQSKISFPPSTKKSPNSSFNLHHLQLAQKSHLFLYMHNPLTWHCQQLTTPCKIKVFFLSLQAFQHLLSLHLSITRLTLPKHNTQMSCLCPWCFFYLEKSPYFVLKWGTHGCVSCSRYSL